MTWAIPTLALLVGGLIAAIAQASRDWRHPQRTMRAAEKRSW